MKKLFITAIFTLFAINLLAQGSEVTNLRLEVRTDYQKEFIDGNKIDANSGFRGKHINLRLDGNITEGLSYSFRYRLNRANGLDNFFSATDWLNLKYTASDNWAFAAGKQIIYIGGYEYDRAPIDLYICSEFWHNLACYQFGASSTYTTDSGNDSFIFQFCESPFRRNALNVKQEEMFAYNLMWYGKHDWFESTYSLNAFEWMPGKFVSFIALGNQFTFGDFRIQFDYMTRAANIDDMLGKNMSVMTEVLWKATDKLNVIAKMTYDRNFADDNADLCVMPGTDLLRAGAVLEYFPIKNYKDLRMHLSYCFTDGKSPATTALQPMQTIINTGITWKVGLLNNRKNN